MVPSTRQLMNRKICTILLLVMVTLTPQAGYGQGRPITLDEAVRTALQSNPGLKSTALEVDIQKQLKRTATEIPKTQAMLMSGQYNSLNTDNNLTLTQSIPFPTVFTSQAKLGTMYVQSSVYKRSTSENELTYQVKQVYQMLRYLHARHALLLRQDSIFSDLVHITSLQYKTGEATLLQKTSAETRYNEVQNLIRQNQADQRTYGSQLQILMTTPDEIMIMPDTYLPLSTSLVDDSTQVASNPMLAYQHSLSNIAAQQKRVDSNKALPDLTVGYFNQTLIGFQQQLNGTDRYFSSDDRFSGFLVGVAIPIWFIPAHARVKASSIRSSAAQLNAQYLERQLYGEWHRAVQQFYKYQNSLEYYNRSALPNAELILRQSNLAYRAGDISQADYRLNLQQAIAIEEAYLQNILQYNQSIITLEFLSGKYSKK